LIITYAEKMNFNYLQPPPTATWYWTSICKLHLQPHAIRQDLLTPPITTCY